MKSRIIFILLVSCLLVTSTAIFAQEHKAEDLKKQIDKINQILDKATLVNDYETISAYYVEDVLILPNGEPLIRGNKAFIENEKKAAAAGFKIIKIETSQIDMFTSGNLVHEVGQYKITLQVPGVPHAVTDTGKYLVIWEIQSDGSLKVKLEMWNNDTSTR